LIGLWGAQLLNTDAYYVNYAMLLVITGICFFQNIKEGKTGQYKSRGKYSDAVINVFAALFSCMVAFANYKIWSFAEMPEEYGKLFKWLLSAGMTVVFFAGGYIAFRHIFHAVYSGFESVFWKQNNKENTKPLKVFW
jgi:hypothetical protein